MMYFHQNFESLVLFGMKEVEVKSEGYDPFRIETFGSEVITAEIQRRFDRLVPEKYENYPLKMAYARYAADQSLIIDEFNKFWEHFKNLLSSDFRCKKCSKPFQEDMSRHIKSHNGKLSYSQLFDLYHFPMMFPNDRCINVDQ